jgi:hypothetical protein
MPIKRNAPRHSFRRVLNIGSVLNAVYFWRWCLEYPDLGHLNVLCRYRPIQVVRVWKRRFAWRVMMFD